MCLFFTLKTLEIHLVYRGGKSPGGRSIKWREKDPPGVENAEPPRNAGPNTNPSTQPKSQPSTQPSKQFYKPPRVQRPLEPTHKVGST